MQVRIDVVAKAYLEQVSGVELSDFDWQLLATNDDAREIVDACREAARVIVSASDLVTETLH